MTRVLVLGELGLAVPDEAVEAVEASSSPLAGSWLPALVGRPSTPPAPGERRTLRLRGGGRVEVPAAMSIEEVEILQLPALLGTGASRRGIVGITTLSTRLGLICDPRLLPLAPEAKAGP